MKDAVVTMTLDNESKTDTVESLKTVAHFKNIPHRFINNKVRVHVECRDFLAVDTALLLSKAVIIDIYRDPAVYGNIRFKLWNPEMERAAVNTEVVIDGHEVRSDVDGFVMHTVPLDGQKLRYPISSNSVTLLDSVVILPCGSDDVILYK